MAGIWARHPRYAALVAIALFTTFYLLTPYGGGAHRARTLYDSDLPSRVERSKNIYDKLLKNRQGLIKRFGPTPNSVELYVVSPISQARNVG